MGEIGYRVVYGKDSYQHIFGGEKWNVPVCPQCNKKVHQIFTFDLVDPRLQDFRVGNLMSLPLITCVNCSLYEDTQVFKLNANTKTISTLVQSNIFEWKYEEDLEIPTPLPISVMKLIEMEPYDMPTNEQEEEMAFEAMGRDYICRLKGKPLYAIDSIDFQCPCCQKKIIYVAELTGEDYDKEGELTGSVPFQIGESIIYFFFCKECLVIRTELQST
jgi:hypothetical protein